MLRRKHQGTLKRREPNLWSSYPSRLLSTAASLLIILTNPLNVTLLTSQLLTAPAIWSRPDGLNTCLQVLQTFHSACRSLGQQQQQGLAGTLSQAPRIGGSIPPEEWIRAVIKGADPRSPRWRHLLPIGGLLLGIEKDLGQLFTPGTKRDLVDALVKATNLALQEIKHTGDLPGHCITLVSNFTFESVPVAQWNHINQDVCWLSLVVQRPLDNVCVGSSSCTNRYSVLLTRGISFWLLPWTDRCGRCSDWPQSIYVAGEQHTL